MMLSKAFGRWAMVGFLVMAALAGGINRAVADQGEDPNEPISILEWLVTDSVEQALPAFDEVKNLEGKVFELKNLLGFEPVEIKEWWPMAGDELDWDGELKLQWRQRAASEDPNHFVRLSEGAEDGSAGSAEMIYLAAYVEAKRWMKIELEVKSCHLLKAYLDNQEIATKASSEKPAKKESAKPGKATAKLVLETGKHLLLIKALRDPNNAEDWQIQAELKPDEGWQSCNLVLGVDPASKMNLGRLAHSPSVGQVSISPDGELIGLVRRGRKSLEGKSESWLELRRSVDNSLVNTYRGGMKISSIKWAPVGRKFSYTSSENGERTLWLVDLETGLVKPLIEDVKEMGGYSWSPEGSFIIYSVTEKPEKDETEKTGLRRVRGMEDRQSGWRNRSFLYQLNVATGTRRRLTAGRLSTNLNSISPDGKKVLFSQSRPNYEERPYEETEMFVLELSTMKVESLWKNKWSASAQWSPDGEKLLVTGGPATFGEIGENVPAGMITNDYDTQAFIFDLQTKEVDPITREFDPQIKGEWWSKTEDAIYFRAVDKSHVRLFRFDPAAKTYEVIDTGVEVLGGMDIAENYPRAVYTGSSAAMPLKVFTMELKERKPQLLLYPGQKEYRDVTLSEVERWTFRNERNVEIEGRIYYPPEFDAGEEYPCMVYYYGGTNPVSRSFDGSYPYNLWAGQGYVVYILQPSGATGFGQEFSALHVNDWGIIVADEIIDGVKQFLAAHAFVDAERVGCLGASYGGFMTQLLQTRTDIFAAAVSHAGISSISSYWGEGYWGYLYCAISAADSHPWSRPELFVKQSSLFNADKINTPLLLLHGTVDTNVPPGESIQLFTALKLLGREVELVEVEGQNHGISEYKKRKLWMKTIMAWFDKHLKDQPQWWEELYEEK